MMGQSFKYSSLLILRWNATLLRDLVVPPWLNPGKEKGN